MRIPALRTASRWILALVALALAQGLAAQTKPKLVESGAGDPKSIIYIGNSFFYYNNGINGHVTNFVQAGEPGKALRSTMVTISGSGFDWHDVESYFRPNGLGKYSFDAQNNVNFNKIDKLFDVAIMMDCSQCPLHPQLKGVFAEYAKKQADVVRKHGTKPVFFMSWAYQDKPEMTAQLAEAYTRAANDNDAYVIPAGLAFARHVAARPDVNLYVADKRHPSLAGSYLAAATTYAAIFKKSPVGSTYAAGLDPALAKSLQQAAWDTVQEYYGKAL
jgi:hypothetical protein